MPQALWQKPHTKLSTEKAKGKFPLQIEKAKGCPRRAAFFVRADFVRKKGGFRTIFAI